MTAVPVRPVLYNYDLDPDCYTVRLVASVLRLPLDTVALDIFPGRDHLTEAMLMLNPAGRLPVLVDGDLVLTRMPAILWHLASQPDAALPLIPPNPAAMLEWLTFAATDLASSSVARAASIMGLGDPVLPRAAARKALRRLDDHMIRQGIHGHGHVAGPTLTLADLALFAGFALSRDYNVDHDEFPALRLWARRVRAVRGFITMPGIPDYH